MRYIRALLLSVIISNVLAEENRCSKYDFEEKILEILVRMEFNENQKHADFERINADVGGKLVKMESLSANVNTSMAELDLKVNDAVVMVADNAPKVFIDLEKKMSKLEKQIIDKLEKIQKTTQTVAFKARLSSDIGAFTSPVNGTYTFDVVLCPYNTKYVAIAIVTDDEQNNIVLFYGNSGDSCYSANAVVVLKSGQQVKVTVLTSGTGTKINQGSDRWNTFSGLIIHT